MAEKITAKDLADKKSDFVLIDVREADEVAEDGTIEGGYAAWKAENKNND